MLFSIEAKATPVDSTFVHRDFISHDFKCISVRCRCAFNNGLIEFEEPSIAVYNEPDAKDYEQTDSVSIDTLSMSINGQDAEAKLKETIRSSIVQQCNDTQFNPNDAPIEYARFISKALDRALVDWANIHKNNPIPDKISTVITGEGFIDSLNKAYKVASSGLISFERDSHVSIEIHSAVYDDHFRLVAETERPIELPTVKVIFKLKLPS